jgi:hypothetical protein
MVDPIGRPPADTDHPTVLDGDVACASVAAQHTRRLHPPLDLCLGNRELLIDPDRPRGVLGVRSPRSPHLRHPIAHITHEPPVPTRRTTDHPDLTPTPDPEIDPDEDPDEQLPHD